MPVEPHGGTDRVVGVGIDGEGEDSRDVVPRPNQTIPAQHGLALNGGNPDGHHVAGIVNGVAIERRQRIEGRAIELAERPPPELVSRNGI